MNTKNSNRNLEKCILCGKKEPLTGEHIFSDWISKVSSSPNLTWTDLYLSRGSETVHTAINEPHDDSKLDVLCFDCNTIWGSRKQSAAKRNLAPLLLGEWPRINEDGKKIIAWWATSFAMVREFVHPEVVTTPQLVRQRFRATSSPPPGWRIWMRPYDGYRDKESRHVSLQVLGVTIPNVFMQLFVTGKMVFFVFGPSDPWLSEYMSTPSYAMKKALVFHQFVEIWPSHKYFPKIPPPPLKDAEYAAIIDTFIGVMENPMDWIGPGRPSPLLGTG